jgi:ATPase subunit of ABC transporter with duplicated ATPase domains
MTVARLAQEVPVHGDASVFDVVAEGLGDLGTLVRDYFYLSHHMTVTTTADELAQLAHIQRQLDDRGGWEIEQRTERVISRLGLDAETPFNALCAIGPNGVGKSTLCGSCSGTWSPSPGPSAAAAIFGSPISTRCAPSSTRSAASRTTSSAAATRCWWTARAATSCRLRDFLFSPERARQPVKALSGGERNRLLLAKLCTRPVNLPEFEFDQRVAW